MKIDKTILLISPSSTIGGKAAFTKNLIIAYSKVGIKFYHIDLIRASSNNLIIRVIEHFYSFFYYKILVLKYLITKPIDIVQIHTSSKFDFWDLSLFVITSKLFRKEIFVRYGGAIFHNFYYSGGKIKKFYISWIFSLFTVFIVQSTYWRNFFIGIGVNSAKLFVLPNFVDEKLFDFKRSSYNLANINILYMPGTSLYRKGFFNLKNSIEQLAIKYPQVSFHIIGPEVNKHISGQNIFTYKEIYGEEKISLFACCYIYLLPTHSEGFPNSLLEAMAAGMGIITTNIPQISCLVEHNKQCLLLSPGAINEFKEKFEYLIINPEEIYRLGNNAKETVKKHYSIDLLPYYLSKLYS